MARADLIKRLFSSFINNDKELFIKTANEIVSDERKINHSIFADELDMILKGSHNLNKSMSNIQTYNQANHNNDCQLVTVVYPDKYLDEIILSAEIYEQITEIIHEFRNWDILQCNGVLPTRNILFYGPPGCGKTICAHAIAAELGIPLMIVRFDAIVSSYLGETAANIGRVFDNARNSNYVILFDEFDAIGRSRDDVSEHGEIKRVVNTFLQQIDNFKGHSIVIAATNYENSLDYAIWRRFDETVEFGLPTLEVKKQLLSLYLRQFQGPFKAFDTFIKDTEKFSHSDIEAICKTIIRRCIMDGRHNYSKKDIEFAVSKQKRLVSQRKTQY